uniref:G-protein coupled receptors family 1 profile domain-containing protein n=1 Tax=Naja naja TaxID=35670 RepID=A0A8C6YE80_NAJNA
MKLLFFENDQIPDILNFTDTIITNVIIFTICFLGLLGNGKVIWILGFHMKRNSFSIYVLNLAVADCGVIIMKVLTQISKIQNPFDFSAYFTLNLLSFVLYNTSQLLLISISVDRCVSVLFPIWHQCHRPPKLSLIVCIITWVLPFVYFLLELVVLLQDHFLLFQLIFNGLISYPLMVISSLILLVKFFFKQHQQKRKRVLTVTLLALMCFVVFRLPLSIFSIITYNKMIFDFFLTYIYTVHPWFQQIFILKDTKEDEMRPDETSL